MSRKNAITLGVLALVAIAVAAWRRGPMPAAGDVDLSHTTTLPGFKGAVLGYDSEYAFACPPDQSTALDGAIAQLPATPSNAQQPVMLRGFYGVH